MRLNYVGRAGGGGGAQVGYNARIEHEALIYDFKLDARIRGRRA
jgi:hypothetical protein